MSIARELPRVLVNDHHTASSWAIVYSFPYMVFETINTSDRVSEATESVEQV